MRGETTLTLVYLKEKRMRQTDIEAYANGVAQMSDWRRTITIRPSYKLKAHTSDRIIERMSKSLKARIFYTMEQDWNGEMYHLHLLINKNVSNDKLSQASGLNPKAIKYNQPIHSEGIVGYILKNLNNNNFHYNIF